MMMMMFFSVIVAVGSIHQFQFVCLFVYLSIHVGYLTTDPTNGRIQYKYIKIKKKLNHNDRMDGIANDDSFMAIFIHLLFYQTIFFLSVPLSILFSYLLFFVIFFCPVCMWHIFYFYHSFVAYTNTQTHNECTNHQTVYIHTAFLLSIIDNVPTTNGTQKKKK